MRLLPAGFAFALVALVAACDDPNQLADATIPNVVDTVTISALEGTPVTSPSAFSVADSRPVRTDLTSAFDFAYNVDATTQHVFLTLEVLGLSNTSGSGPGLQHTGSTFDEITRAPSSGWVTNDTVSVTVGDVLYARSRIVCSNLGVPLYGKLEVLSIDDAPGVRTITFQVLTNTNCGYHGLEPGIPSE
jgi:hypothetical protein